METVKWVVRWRPAKANDRTSDGMRIDCCWRGPVVEGPAAWLRVMWLFPEEQELFELMMNDHADGIAEGSPDESLLDHFECYHGDRPVVNWPRRYGLKSMTKRDLCHYAAAGGWTDVIRMPIKKGAPIDQSDVDGWRPIHYAVFRGHANVVAELVKAGVPLDRIDGTNPDGVPAIHYASAKGNIEMVRILIENGIDVNVKDAFGWTALHFAMYNNHSEVEKLLNSAGADRSLKNADGMTPLDFEKRQPKAYEEFMSFPVIDDEERERIRELLLKRIVFKDEPVGSVLAYIEQESRKADPSGKGVRILRMRSEEGRKEATITMDFEDIPLGEAISYVCEGGDLKYQVRDGSYLIMDPGVTSARMETWCSYMDLTLAEDESDAHKRFDMRKYLEDKGVGFAVDGSGGGAKAHCAQDGKLTFRNHVEERGLIMSIMRFINGGFPVTTRIYSFSPLYCTDLKHASRLHMAVYFRDEQIVRGLLKSGHGVNVVDENGATPLDWARTKRLRKILRKHGGKTGDELGTTVVRNWKQETGRPPEEEEDDDDDGAGDDDDDDGLDLDDDDDNTWGDEE